MDDRMRWAVLGTGKISNRFAAALNNIPERAELLAVGSRQAANGQAFAQRYGIPRVHEGYQAVADDPDVQIVYIGTPGVFHLRDVRMCLEAGKHVLCEKAMTMNAAQAEGMIALAREKRLFLMEAMWTRFFPIHIEIRELLRQGVIGQVTGMMINFAAAPPFDLTNRWYDLNLGASVLLDTGAYGVSWAFNLLGKPQETTGLAYIGPSGADYSSAYILKYAGGPLVSIFCSQISYDYKEAVILGTNGRIEVHDPWYKPTRMTIYTADGGVRKVEKPLGKYNGYEYEALAVMDCIQQGKTECVEMPLDESLEIMRVLDGLRAQWGLKYPFE